MASTAVFVGLGSNLDDPRAQVAAGVRELARLPCTDLEACSSLYRSEPMGPQDQPDYVNAVARLRTELSPQVLLDELQAIERRHGRQRVRHWGPRTLDLDILLYGRRRITGARLRVPHPGIATRSFVLYPLAEIDEGLEIPGLGRVTELLSACPRGRLVRLQPALHSAV